MKENNFSLKSELKENTFGVVTPKIEVKRQKYSSRRIPHISMRISQDIGVRTTIIDMDSSVKKIVEIINPIKSNTGIELLMSSIK